MRKRSQEPTPGLWRHQALLRNGIEATSVQQQREVAHRPTRRSRDSSAPTSTRWPRGWGQALALCLHSGLGGTPALGAAHRRDSRVGDRIPRQQPQRPEGAPQDDCGGLTTDPGGSPKIALDRGATRADEPRMPVPVEAPPSPRGVLSARTRRRLPTRRSTCADGCTSGGRRVESPRLAKNEATGLKAVGL
jgi:hypothetical protein